MLTQGMEQVSEVTE